MNCPIDGAQLVMSERSGIEIDYCPNCRGVWLDRGELDKIIDRSMALAPSAPVAPQAPAAPAAFPARSAAPAYGEQRDPRSYGEQRYGDDRGRGGYGDDRSRKRKKENWLSELFD